MNLLETIILGALQGVTEFLPVSSSGHLAIFKNIFGLSDIGITYDLLLHLGTLVAVFIAFYKDIWELIINGFSLLADIFNNSFIYVQKLFNLKKAETKKYTNILETPYKRFVLLIIVSSVPAAVLGFMFKDMVEEAGKTLLLPGMFLLITGVILIIGDKSKKGTLDESNTSFKKSIIIGFFQAFAILPGISRSGSTISASLICGLDRTFAVRYSFIMSIPVILGAAVFDLKDLGAEKLSQNEILYYAIGTVVAAIVGYACIKGMLKIIKKKSFVFFAFYCFLAGSIAIIGHFVM